MGKIFFKFFKRNIIRYTHAFNHVAKYSGILYDCCRQLQKSKVKFRRHAQK